MAIAIVVGALSSCAGDAATAAPDDTVATDETADTDETSATDDTSAGGAASSGAGTYTIVAGDTLSGIAMRADVSLDDLVAVNGWPDGTDHLIVPGDVVMLPHGAATPASPPAPPDPAPGTVVTGATTPPAATVQVDGAGVLSCDSAAIAAAIGDSAFVTFDEIGCENDWAGGGYIDSEGHYRPVILRAEGQVWMVQELATVCDRYPDMPDLAKRSCPGG